jgi:Tfp pilus assembly protein, tip-associated adhesin PilY1
MPNLAGSTSQYGNFVQSNLSKIHAETSPVTRFNTAQTAQMIDFVRGRDVFNDADAPSGVAGDRWKLSDIYHSPPIFVGAPSGTIAPSSFPTSASFKSEAEYRSAYNYESFQKSFACGVRCLSRNEIIYAGSNAGLLHAFDKSGNEKWAFMPFTYRHQWGSNNPSYASSRKSSSTYGVDGPIVARDVFVNNKWRTLSRFHHRPGREICLCS